MAQCGGVAKRPGFTGGCSVGPGGGTMSKEELARHELHGMHPVLGVPDMGEAIAYYRDVLGFYVDFVAGDPPAHARLCSSPVFEAPGVFIRFEPLARGAAPNPRDRKSNRLNSSHL